MEHQVGILRVLRAQQTRGALSPEAVVAVKTLVLSKGDDPSLRSIWSFFEETKDEADLVDNLLIMAGLPPGAQQTAPAQAAAAPPATPVPEPSLTPTPAYVPTAASTAISPQPTSALSRTAPAAATAVASASPATTVVTDAMPESTLEPSLMSAAHRWDIVYLFSEPLVLLNYSSGMSQPLTALDFETEIKWMSAALREANRSVSLYAAPATVNTFNQALASGATSVLHLSGHGWQNGIALEGDNGRAQILSYEDFKERLGEQLHTSKLHRQSNDHHLRLVFVSSCHSESVGRAFADCGVPHVIAIKSDCKVTDEGAQLFMQQFYTAIITGHTVAQAFRTAQTSVRLQKKHVPEVARDADAFILMGKGVENPGQDPKLIQGDVYAKHQVPIFHNLPIGELKKVLPPSVVGCSVPDVWVGRQNDIQQAVSHLCGAGSIVTITGPPGIGKSSLAKVAANYVANRKYFSEGVYYIDCAATLTVDALITLICDKLDCESDGAVEDITPPARLEKIMDTFLEDPVSSLLLVLDNLDVLLILRRDEMRRFFAGLFERRGGLKIMTPLGTDLGDIAHTTAQSIVLKKMSDAETARMLVQTVQSPIKLIDLQRSMEEEFGADYVSKFLESQPEPAATAGTPLTSSIPTTATGGVVDTSTAALAALTLTSSMTTPATTPRASELQPSQVWNAVSDQPSAEFVPKYETLENIAELIADTSSNDADSKSSGTARSNPDAGATAGLSGDLSALVETQFHEAMPEEKPTRTERLSYRFSKRRQHRSLAPAAAAAEKPPGAGHRSSGSRSDRSQLGAKIPLRSHRKSRATAGQSTVTGSGIVPVNLDASVRLTAARFLDVFKGFLQTHAGTPGLLNCAAPVLLLQQHPIITCLQGHPLAVRAVASLLRHRSFADVYHVLHTHPARGEWINQVPESDISQIEESLRTCLLAIDVAKKGALSALYLLSLLPASLRLHYLRGIWPSKYPVSTASRFVLTARTCNNAEQTSVISVQALDMCPAEQSTPHGTAAAAGDGDAVTILTPATSQTPVSSVQVTSPVTSPIITKSDSGQEGRGPIDDYLEPLLRAYLIDKVSAPTPPAGAGDDEERTSGSSELLESSSSGDEEALAFSAFLFGPDESMKLRGPPEEKYLYGESEDLIVLMPVLAGLVRRYIPTDEKALLISALAKFCAKMARKILQTMRARRVSHEFDAIEPVMWRLLELAVDEAALTFGDILAQSSAAVGSQDTVAGCCDKRDQQKEGPQPRDLDALMAQISDWLDEAQQQLLDMPDWSSVDRATLQQRNNQTNFGYVAAVFPRILLRLGRGGSDILEACKLGANLCRSHFDLTGLAGIFHTLAQHYERNRQFDYAFNYACKSAQLHLALRNVLGLGFSCHVLGSMLAEQQKLQQAVRVLEWGRALFSSICDAESAARGEIQCMRTLGDIHRRAGEFEEALVMFERVIQKASVIGDRVGMVNAIVSMAHAMFKDHYDKRQPFPPSMLELLGKQLDWAISTSCELEYKQGIGMAKAWRSVVCYYSALQGLVLTSLVSDAAAVAAASARQSETDADSSALSPSEQNLVGRPGGSEASSVPPIAIPAADRELVRGLSLSSSDASPTADNRPTADESSVSDAWDMMRKAEAMAVESLDLLHETGEDLSIPRMTLEHMRRFLSQIR